MLLAAFIPIGTCFYEIVSCEKPRKIRMGGRQGVKENGTDWDIATPLESAAKSDAS